jgi:hypothetical protein
VVTAFLAGVAVLVTVVRLGLFDGITFFGTLTLADPALVALVVDELRQIDYLDRDPHRVRPGLPEIAVLNELREVLAALLADLAVAFEVVSQTHRSITTVGSLSPICSSPVP